MSRNTLVESTLPDRSSYERAIEIVWLSIIFLLPLFFNPASHQSFYLNKALLLQFLVMTMLALVVADCIYKGTVPGILRWRHSISAPLYLSILLFGFIALISTCMSITPSISFWGSWARKAGLITILCWVVFFLIIASYLRSRKQLSHAIAALLLSSGFVAVLGILQYYWPEGSTLLGYRPFTQRVFSTTGNALALSGFLAMVIPLTIGFAFVIWNEKRDKKNIWVRTGIVLLLALQFWCLYLAQYSVTVLLFIIAPVIYITLLGIVNRRILLFIAGLVALLLIAIVAVMLIMPLLFHSAPDDINERDIVSTTNVESLELNTLANRVQHWKNSVRMMIESSDKSADYDEIAMLRPFIGTGPETFIVTYQGYYPKKLDTFMTSSGMLLDRPHNHYIYIAASMGLLGLLSFLSILSVFFYLSYVLLKRIEANNERFIIIGLVASMAGYLVDSIFNPTTLLTELVFWLALGLIIGMERFSFASLNDRLATQDDEISTIKTWPEQKYRIVRYYGAACVAIALIAIGGIFTVRPFLADIHLQRGLDFRASNIQQSLNEFDKAIDLQPQEAAYWGYLGEYSYSLSRNFSDSSLKKEFLTLSTDSYERARDLEPYIAYRYYSLADIYLYEAKESDSEKWPAVFSNYDRALLLFPDNAVIMNKSVLASYIRDDIDSAWGKLDKSATFDPNWSETVYLSALLLISEDEDARAMRIIDDEINNSKGARYYLTLNYFSQFCQRLANYRVLDQLHSEAEQYVEEMPDEWTPHAVYAFTSFYSGEAQTSIDEFDYAMTMVPDEKAGNLFRAIYGLIEIAPGYGFMIADTATGWWDKLERTADSEFALTRLDALMQIHVSE